MAPWCVPGTVGGGRSEYVVLVPEVGSIEMRAGDRGVLFGSTRVRVLGRRGVARGGLLVEFQGGGRGAGRGVGRGGLGSVLHHWKR